VVGDAHEVAVPRGLKVQAPEPNFEPGWEGVRAGRGTWCESPSRGLVGADLQRDPLPDAPTVGAE
jgi:hypothetical protein